MEAEPQQKKQKKKNPPRLRLRAQIVAPDLRAGLCRRLQPPDHARALLRPALCKGRRVGPRIQNNTALLHFGWAIYIVIFFFFWEQCDLLPLFGGVARLFGLVVVVWGRLYYSFYPFWLGAMFFFLGVV
jgi:hypothetical protein